LLSRQSNCSATPPVLFVMSYFRDRILRTFA
jgi:hypothetical protein